MSYYDFSGYAQDNSQQPQAQSDVKDDRRKPCNVCHHIVVPDHDDDGDYCPNCCSDI